MERLAFSCVWTLDVETAEIIDVKFHKSVIKSVAAMSYAKAQVPLGEPQHSHKRAIHIGKRTLLRLAVLAGHHR